MIYAEEHITVFKTCLTDGDYLLGSSFVHE